MISTRFAWPTAVLLAVALVPTTIHTYMRSVATDGLTATAVEKVLHGMPSTGTDRRRAWVKSTFDSDDWIERIYQAPGGEDVRLFVGRSYDAKRLYHHPELALLRGIETGPAGVGRSPARPDIPLHVLTTERNGQSGVAVYALHYDGRFVEDPVWFQIRTAVESIITRRKPMTLFLATDLSGSPAAIDRAAATGVLLAAIESFERQGRR